MELVKYECNQIRVIQKWFGDRDEKMREKLVGQKNSSYLGMYILFCYSKCHFVNLVIRDLFEPFIICFVDCRF